MKRKTPAAPKREGGEFVKSGDLGFTPTQPKSQPSEWLRVPRYAHPSDHASQMLEKADVYEATAGLEHMASVFRSRADLIRRGRFWQEGAR